MIESFLTKDEAEIIGLRVFHDYRQLSRDEVYALNYIGFYYLARKKPSGTLYIRLELIDGLNRELKAKICEQDL